MLKLPGMFFSLVIMLSIPGVSIWIVVVAVAAAAVPISLLKFSFCA